jgi:hypothetical protein
LLCQYALRRQETTTPTDQVGPGSGGTPNWMDRWMEMFRFCLFLFFSGGDDEGRKKNVDDLVREREMTFTCLDAVKLTAS